MQAVSLSNSTLGLNQTEQTELAMHIFFVFTGYSPEKWNGRFTRVDCLWFVPPEGQMTDEVKTSSAIRAYWQDWGLPVVMCKSDAHDHPKVASVPTPNLKDEDKQLLDGLACAGPGSHLPLQR